MPNPLAQPLQLPNGTILSNRIAKAAMSEGLADARNHSTPRLETLYRRWANSGAGLLLSGNIQVDRWHLERPTNVVVDDDTGDAQLARLAAAGVSGGAHFWAQLSHSGRQVSRALNPAPLSPSDVEIEVIRGAGFDFATPKTMTEVEIRRAVRQFAFAAVGYFDGPLAWRGNAGLTWTSGALMVDVNAQYYDSYSTLNADPAYAGNADRAVYDTTVPAQIYVDLAARRRFTYRDGAVGIRVLDVRFGVQNLLDRRPPTIVLPDVLGYSHYGDPRRRRVELAVTSKF